MHPGYFLASRQVRQDERDRGSRMVSMSARNEAAEVILPPHEAVRMFTDDLSGCVAMGYIATRGEGHRQAYMHHAFYGTVCAGEARFAPSSVAGFAPADGVSAKGVIMARSYEPMQPFHAGTSDTPYGGLSTGRSIEPLVASMVERCGDPQNVMVVPYSTIDSGYSRTLVVDVPAFSAGTMLADGRVVA